MSESLESLAERVRRGFGLRYAPWNRQVNANLDAFLQRAQEAEAELPGLWQAVKKSEQRAQEAERALQACRELTGDMLDGERRAEAAEARERKLREALERIANDATPMGFKIIAREALRSLDSEGEAW